MVNLLIIILFIVLGVAMYSVLYNLGLKVYDNIYGKAFLRLLIFLPIGVIGILTMEYSLSSSGYSFYSELLVEILRLVGIIIKPTATLDVVLNISVLVIAFIIYVFFPGKVINKLNIDGLRYNEKKKALIVDGEAGIKAKLPLPLMNISVLFSITYMSIIELVYFNWYVFGHQFGNVLQNIIIVLIMFVILEFIIMTHEMKDYIQELSVRMIFHDKDDYLLVRAIFETYIENAEVILSYVDIDLLVKNFIELGIFQSAFKIDFTRPASEYYRIDINKKLLEIYKEEKESYLGQKNHDKLS